MIAQAQVAAGGADGVTRVSPGVRRRQSRIPREHGPAAVGAGPEGRRYGTSGRALPARRLIDRRAGAPLGPRKEGSSCPVWCTPYGGASRRGRAVQGGLRAVLTVTADPRSESVTCASVLLVLGRPRPTRLETRTKECNMCASPLASKPEGAMKVKARSPC